MSRRSAKSRTVLTNHLRARHTAGAREKRKRCTTWRKKRMMRSRQEWPPLFLFKLQSLLQSPSINDLRSVGPAGDGSRSEDTHRKRRPTSPRPPAPRIRQPLHQIPPRKVPMTKMMRKRSPQSLCQRDIRNPLRLLRILRPNRRSLPSWRRRRRSVRRTRVMDAVLGLCRYLG